MSARSVYSFHGGIHPPEHKRESNSAAIALAPLPQRLILSLHQHVGNRAKALVSVGERVLAGQMIAAADGAVSAALHAPTSGTVLAVGDAPVAHPSGLPDLCITLETDGLHEKMIQPGLANWREAEGRVVRDFLRDMGVVGYGGAVFPSHLKLNAKSGLETLVINGAECEPYISCDDRLMRERADGIVAGIRIVRELLRAREVLIGIEDNKPEAAAAMRAAIAACDFPIDVVVVPTLYPSGGAKQLIKLLTNKEVPSGVRSTELGVQCFNVATVYHIARAIEHGEPVTTRIVTLTGKVAHPGNYEALLGTPLAELATLAGAAPDAAGFIYGGPMMGFTVPDLAAGVSKAGNCIIARDPIDLPDPQPEMPCIRCGKCADACPAELQPMDLYWFARGKQFDKSERWNLFDCIECGACAYVCPSSIRLVDYFRFSKSEIWTQEQQEKAADLARQRHEFKTFREEREKAEKAARLAAKAQEKHAAASESADPADAERAAKIKAAMEKAAAKKNAIAAEAAPTEAKPALDPEKAEKIRAAMEKRAAEKAAADAMSPEEKAAKEAEKQAKIAAALAKAAEKKAAGAQARLPLDGPVTLPAEPAPQAEPPAAEAPKPALDPEKAARIREAMEKRAAEKAALEAMSPEQRARLEEEKRARIEAAKAAAAARKAAKE